MSSDANWDAWNAVAALDRERWDRHVQQWSMQNPRDAGESVESWVNRGQAYAYAVVRPPAVLNMWDFLQLFMYRWFHTGPPKPGESRQDYRIHAQNVFNAKVNALTDSQKRHWYFELEGWREKHESELDAATARRWEEEQRAMQTSMAHAAHGPL